MGKPYLSLHVNVFEWKKLPGVIIIPGQGELVSVVTSRLGTGKSLTFFIM
jgi:hypothetical protein